MELPSGLAAANSCLGYHAVAQRIVRHAYQDVALRHKADSAAVANLQASIKAGGAGRWRAVPMPVFPQLTAAQAKALDEFVMKQ